MLLHEERGAELRVADLDATASNGWRSLNRPYPGAARDYYRFKFLTVRNLRMAKVYRAFCTITSIGWF